MNAMQLRKQYPFVKPNNLVYVNLQKTAGYAFIGEVMSYPTPEGTAMVRCVPGFPGTLKEFPLDVLANDGRKPSTMMVHYAVVAGPGRFFPMDMLRYDCAAPVNFHINEDGSVEMIPEFHEFTMGFRRDLYGIDPLIIAACRPKADRHVWTPERWQSFLWSIQRLSSEPLVQRAFDESSCAGGDADAARANKK